MNEFLGREILERFLLSDSVPRDSMGPYHLDGFLTGLASGPTIIPVEEWLPVIWGDGEPQYRSEEQSNLIRSLITRRYNEILRALTRPSEGSMLPDMDDWEERRVMAYAWADGFLQAIELRPSAWLPLMRDKEASMLLMPLLIIFGETVEEYEIPLSPGLRTAILTVAAEQIPLCGHKVNRFWNQVSGDQPVSETGPMADAKTEPEPPAKEVLLGVARQPNHTWMLLAQAALQSGGIASFQGRTPPPPVVARPLP